MNPANESPWLRRWAWLTVAATVALIAIGGLVTSNEAGMAVPDWPTSYGYGMFFLPIRLWTGGALYEHTHRLWASMVGFMTAVLAFWLYGRKARPLLRVIGAVLIIGGLATFATSIPNKFQHGTTSLVPGILAVLASFWWPACDPADPCLRRWGIIAFIAVAVQGILGGLRVTQMADALGVFHGALAQLFLVLLSAMALSMTRFWRELPERTDVVSFTRFRKVLFVVALLVFGQLLLGATMRHQHAGLAVPDFPLAHGQFWPATDAASIDAYNRARTDARDPNPITAAHVYVHMAHRLVAVGLFAFSIWLLVATKRALGRRHPLARFALGWHILVFLQATFGVFTVLTNKAADVATLHVFFGALTLVSIALAAICTWLPALHGATVPMPVPQGAVARRDCSTSVG